jgi:signal transduction histidine kinase
VVLVATLVRIRGGFDLDRAAPPTAAVWATVALHRAQHRLMRELTATRGELAARQREAGRLAERARLARDLHDTLAQEIAGSRMLLQAAERDWDRRPDIAARRQVRAVVDALGTHLAETRGIIHDLTPARLARDGLESALHELCARADAAPGAPAVSVSTRGEPRPVRRPGRRPAPRDPRSCWRTRANTHAPRMYGSPFSTPTRAVQRSRSAMTEVGFDPRPRYPPGAGRGFGLASARDRLRVFGGTLTVDSTPGKGTRVRAALQAKDRIPVGAR